MGIIFQLISQLRAFSLPAVEVGHLQPVLIEVVEGGDAGARALRDGRAGGPVRGAVRR